ncbi:hypothetical protein MST22_04665 [Virgibacillus halodenitrificans]|uniref:hypothetical protein n=1 Tax=Virgibacillus halodenitrificans TaxID=1482 RepID=UPI001FB23EB8|nr:hypothetical protein [Virgibacillus halodenitrificans]MCJ0930441.1 hypothetical protein [Virgibacillus halodenitrificans]
MAKLNETKVKELPTYVQKQLQFVGVNQVKSSTIVMVLIMLDLFIAIPLFYPLTPVFFYITIPLLFITHVWMVRLLFKNPYSTQFEFILFIGTYGLVSAVCFFVLSIKMSIHYLYIESISYYISSPAMFFIVIGVIVYYYHRKFSLISKREAKGAVNQYGPLFALVPALGYMIAQSINHSEVLSNTVLVIVFYFFTTFYSYVGIKFFHKYFFMKKNSHLVKLEQPMKRMQKEFQEKGIVIK